MADMTKWFPTFEVRVATDIDELKRLAYWFNTEFEPPENKDASMWWLENKDQAPVAVVWIGVTKDNEGFWPIVAHEATHIMGDYMHYLGEDTPSSEFMAYTMQAIVSAIAIQIS